MEKGSILIVSSNFRKAYPIVKSISKMGFRTITAFYTWRSTVFSKYANKRYHIPNPYLDEKSYIANVLLIINREKPLMIIPVGFIDNVILSKYRRHIPPDVVLPIPEYSKLVRVSRKDLLAQLCEDLGIKYPKILSSNEEVEAPVVIKGILDSSKPDYAFFKEEFNMKMNGKRGKVIVQEFIPGIGCGYFAIAKNGEVYIDYTHVRIVEKKPSGGPSIVSCINLNPELIALGRSIVKKLKWSGVIMAEFRRHMETGEYYLLEINPKFWGSLELALSKGLDFPKYLVEVFLYNKKPKAEISLKRKCFAWVLESMYYLKQNPKVWFKIVRHALCEGILNTDIHILDPSELIFSLITRTATLFTKSKRINGHGLYKRYAENILSLAIRLNKKPINCVVLDFDGTLFNLRVKWNKLRKLLISRGLLKPWDSIQVGLYKTKNTKHFSKINLILRSAEEKALENIRGDEKVKEMIEELTNKGIKLAIVTKQESFIVRKALKKTGLAGAFIAIIGREHCILRENQLKILFKKIHVKPEEAIVIGDQLSDMVSAAKLGATPIAIARNPYMCQKYIELGVPCFNNIKYVLKFIIRNLKG